MKIVTYNVNGLRQRVSQHGSLLRLLNSLDADIICFQETKLSRQDLSVDVTMAEGYEAFFSCTRGSLKGRLAYSGVATFCRVKSAFSSDEVPLPIAAAEGFTGLLGSSEKRESITADCILETPQMVEGVDITTEDLVKVDSEGRCIITDHGHFVLFNLYGPRAVDEDKERVQFKLVFYKMLQKRWESLLTQGRRVVVVGDLNIAPAAVDQCDADSGFEENMFRTWLRSLLREQGGPFFDVFRSKHPQRREAYTHFSQNVGAEEFNYGSRIDHILIAGPCLHQNHDSEGHNFLDCHVKDCDIMIQFKRGRADNAPKWKGGRSIKLEGSDHVPVYALLSSIPNLPEHNTPPLAVRYIPEVRGWQQTIVSFLRKDVPTTIKKASNILADGNVDAKSSNKSIVSGQDCGTTSSRVVTKKARRSSCSQLSLRSFFQQSNTSSADMEPLTTDTSLTHGDTENGNGNTSHIMAHACNRNHSENTEDNSLELNELSTDPHVQYQDDINLCFSSKMEKDNFAVLQWQKIQEKMKMSLPLCKGHGEPCVARSVKKGPNIGRQFYVCARAKGPESEPEANCGYFRWAYFKSEQEKKVYILDDGDQDERCGSFIGWFNCWCTPCAMKFLTQQDVHVPTDDAPPEDVSERHLLLGSALHLLAHLKEEKREAAERSLHPSSSCAHSDFSHGRQSSDIC